jgi:diguanylate cyclase (GGDEF)-like protein/PAS domain S-box-containing protein
MVTTYKTNPQGPARKLFRAVLQHRFVAGVFLVFAAITCGVTIAVDHGIRQSLRENAMRDAADYERRFRQGIDSYVAFGRNLAAFVEHAPDLDARGFNRYIGSVDVFHAYPGLDRVGYVARAGQGDDHYRVRLVHPGDEIAPKLLNSDFSTIPARWEAMQRARDSGHPVVTARHEGFYGPALRESVVLLVPVYDPAAVANTVEQRRRAVRGFVFLKFDIGDVVERVMGPHFKNLFDLEIYDGVLRRDAIIYDGDSAPHALSATPVLSNVHQQKMMVADRVWNLVFFPKDRYFERYPRTPKELMFLVGLSIGGCAAWLMTQWRRRQRRRAVLIEQGHRFEAIFENYPSAVFSLDLRRRFANANATALATFGRSREELLGRPIEPLLMPENIERFRERFDEAVKGNSVTYESSLLNGMGERIETAVIMIPVTSKGGVSGVLGVIQNVTERKHAEWQLKSSRNMLQLVIDHIPQRVFWKNTELVYIGCNGAFCSDAGMDNPEQLLGKTDFEMAWSTDAEAYRKDDMEVMRAGVPRINYEERQHRPDGDSWLRTSKIPISNEDGAIVGILGLYEDITERKALEHKLEMLAHYDSLTGLASRASFQDRVEQAVARCRRHDSRLALMYLDLDKFKSINDTYGHAAGDELLVQFGARIKLAVREMDVVGRLGGDEFALLMEDVPDEHAALVVAEKIVQGMGAQFAIGDKQLQVSTSVGVAMLAPGMTVDALLAKADEAMYAAKHAGRNGFAVAT